jgi:hypothetical protein
VGGGVLSSAPCWSRVHAGSAVTPGLFLPPSAATEVGLVQFHKPGIFNYSALLMSEDKDTLYVGAREAVFAVNALNISEKQHEVGSMASHPCPWRRGCLRYLSIPRLHRSGYV